MKNAKNYYQQIAQVIFNNTIINQSFGAMIKWII